MIHNSKSKDGGGGLVTKSCLILATLKTVTFQAPLSTGFFRQKYGSGVAISFFRGSSQPRDQTQVFCIAGRFFTNWAIREASVQFSSVQFSRSVVSDSVRPHESQHTRPPCPTPTPGVHSNSRPLSPWCHPAISSSVIPFSSCPQSFPSSGSFPMSQLFALGQPNMSNSLIHYQHLKYLIHRLVQNLTWKIS